MTALVMQRIPWVTALMLLGAIGLAHGDQGRLVKGVVNEPGYQVRFFDGCGFGYSGGKPAYAGAQRGTINDAACAPGGAWGTDLYLAVRHPFDEFDNYLETVYASGNIGHGPLCCGGGPYPFDLSFSPADWRGGDVALVTAYNAYFFQSYTFLSVRTPGATIAGYSCPPDPFGSIFGSVGPAAVDPTGAFGGDLFMDRFCGTEAGVFRIDASGTMTLFSTVGSSGRFGPGGPWGTGLYGAGLVLDPNGTATPFPGGFGEFDWAPGKGFGGDMFAFCGGGMICRVKPDGSRTLFATVPSSGGTPLNVAFCNGSLWVTGDGCYRITPKK